MSDIRPEQETQLGPKQHSGNLPEEMREDHPTGAFRDTTMQEALDAGILDPTSVHDISTMPEVMPPIEHTQAPPLEHQEDRILGTKANTKKRGLIAAGVATVAGLGFAATLLLGGGGDKDEKVVSATPTTEQPTATTDSTTATTERGVSTNPEAGPGTISVERVNGEVVTLEQITDADIESGEAATILRNAISLYITTGEGAILDAFVDTTSADGAVASWNQYRIDLNVDYELDLSPDTAIQYDTRSMEATKSEESTEVEAIIETHGGQDLMISSGSPEWDAFDYENAATVQVASGTPSQDLNMHFRKYGEFWQFIGYEVIE